MFFVKFRAGLFLSPHHLAQIFKRATNQTVRQYIIRRRLERAKILLADNAQSVAEVAAATGFFDQSHFAKCFRRAVGCSPREFQLRTNRFLPKSANFLQDE